MQEYMARENAQLPTSKRLLWYTSVVVLLFNVYFPRMFLKRPEL
jgi:hypothetical protein